MSVNRAANCLPSKIVDYEGNKMVAFSLEGYMETQEIDMLYKSIDKNEDNDTIQQNDNSSESKVSKNDTSYDESLDAVDSLLDIALDKQSTNSLKLYLCSNCNEKFDVSYYTQAKLKGPPNKRKCKFCTNPSNICTFICDFKHQHYSILRKIFSEFGKIVKINYENDRWIIELNDFSDVVRA